jgi:hypothetical protein
MLSLHALSAPDRIGLDEPDEMVCFSRRITQEIVEQDWCK